jgi:hypothetical protein
MIFNISNDLDLMLRFEDVLQKILVDRILKWIVTIINYLIMLRFWVNYDLKSRFRFNHDYENPGFEPWPKTMSHRKFILVTSLLLAPLQH